MAHLKRPKVSYILHALHSASWPSSGFDPCSSLTTLTTLMTSGQVSDTGYLAGMETLRLAAAAPAAAATPAGDGDGVGGAGGGRDYILSTSHVNHTVWSHQHLQQRQVAEAHRDCAPDTGQSRY